MIYFQPPEGGQNHFCSSQLTVQGRYAPNHELAGERGFPRSPFCPPRLSAMSGRHFRARPMPWLTPGHRLGECPKAFPLTERVSVQSGPMSRHLPLLPYVRTVKDPGHQGLPPQSLSLPTQSGRRTSYHAPFRSVNTKAKSGPRYPASE